MICLKDIKEFYQASENYVLGCSDDLELVKKLYRSVIKDSDDEINQFASA